MAPIVPLPPVDGVVKFSVQGGMGVRPWTNVLHWAYTGGLPTDADMTAFCQALHGLWATNLCPLMANAGALLAVKGVDLSSALSGAGEFIATVPGSRGASDLPANCAVLVNKFMPRRYRGGHPRSYIVAGVQGDLNSPSTWEAALTDAVTLGYTTISVALLGHTSGATTLGGELNVSYYSKIFNPIAPYRRALPEKTPITGSAAVQAIATQRRRIGR